MRFHAELAEVAEAKTEFRLLNMAPPIMLGLGGENDGVNHTRLTGFLDRRYEVYRGHTYIFLLLVHSTLSELF